MLFLAHGDIGSADEIVLGFVAFGLLLWVIFLAIRDWWKGRKRLDQAGNNPGESASRID